jgi:hypothetical protein
LAQPAFSIRVSRCTNLTQYGYALDPRPRRPRRWQQAHLGQLAASGSPRGWDSAGPLTPINRFAQMLSGTGPMNSDGTEWYFPMRLTIDAAAVADGNANPAQAVLDVHTTHGHDLPRRLRIYAFGAGVGGPGVLATARVLANQSRVPPCNLTLIDRQSVPGRQSLPSTSRMRLGARLAGSLALARLLQLKRELPPRLSRGM